MKKRILAAILSAAMIFTQVPAVYADAEEAVEESTDIVEEAAEENADCIAEETENDITAETQNSSSVYSESEEVSVTESAEEEVPQEIVSEEAAEEVLQESVSDETEEDSSETSDEDLSEEDLSEEETADEINTKEAVQETTAEDLEFEISGETYSDPDGADNDDLFAQYVDEVFSGEESDSIHVNAVASAGSFLNASAKVIYDSMLAQAGQIADGKVSSAIFTFDLNKIYGNKKPTTTGFTGADLGIGDITQANAGEAGQLLYNTIFWEPFLQAYEALVADTPYELYWYDKVTGVSSEASGLRGYQNSEGNLVICFKSSTVRVALSVSTDYSDNTTEEFNNKTLRLGLDTKKTGAASASHKNAESIRTKYAGASDYDKLRGYKNEICDLVTYNDEAANTEGYPYGDPWQMIYVFDGDPDTNVVCEGYSKAFKYLCDNTKFSSSDIKAIIVSGTVYRRNGTGGGHMWNIVSMDNRLNYLVDVTWCDNDGDPDDWDDLSFLVGTTQQNGNTYVFPNSNGQTYIYDDETVSSYDTYSLQLASANYDPDNVAECSHENTKVENAVAATCTADGYTGDTYCLNCGFLKKGSTISKTGHSFTKYVSDKNATYIADGTKTAKCNNCTATKTVTDTGSKKAKTSLSGCTVKLSFTSKVYTGSAIKPTVTVKNGTKTVPAKYYTVTYSNNVAPGTAAVKVTAKSGNIPYSGSKSAAFKITVKTISISKLSNASKGITVKWPKVTGASGYYIYRGSSKIKTITSGSTVSYTDAKAVTNGKKYTYKVIAYRTVNGKKVTVARSGAKYYYALTRPVLKKLKNSASKTMTVTLSARNKKANGYQIQYSTARSFSSVKTVTITKNSTLAATIKKLTKGKTYYVRVRAYKKVGKATYYSAWSAAKSVKISK